MMGVEREVFLQQSLERFLTRARHDQALLERPQDRLQCEEVCRAIVDNQNAHGQWCAE